MKTLLTLSLIIYLSITPTHAKTITIIGDSIVLSTQKNLKECLSRQSYNVIIDAKKGRQFKEGVKILKRKKNLGDIVIIALGTNGLINEKDLDEVIKYCKSKNVYVIFVNNKVPKPWQDINNRLLKEKTNNIIDWYMYSKNCNNCFGKDNYHLNEKGRSEFSKLICGELHTD